MSENTEKNDNTTNTDYNDDDFDYLIGDFTDEDYFPDSERQTVTITEKEAYEDENGNTQTKDVTTEYEDCYVIPKNKIKEKAKKKIYDGSDLTNSVNNLQNIRAAADKAIWLHVQGKTDEADKILSDFSKDHGDSIKIKDGNVIVVDNCYSEICDDIAEEIDDNYKSAPERTADKLINLAAEGKYKEADKILPGFSNKYKDTFKTNSEDADHDDKYNDLCEAIEAKSKTENLIKNIDKFENDITNDLADGKLPQVEDESEFGTTEKGIYMFHYPLGLAMESASRSAEKLKKSLKKMQVSEEHKQKLKELCDTSMTSLNSIQNEDFNGDNVALNTSIQYAKTLSDKELAERLNRVHEIVVKNNELLNKLEPEKTNTDDVVKTTEEKATEPANSNEALTAENSDVSSEQEQTKEENSNLGQILKQQQTNEQQKDKVNEQSSNQAQKNLKQKLQSQAHKKKTASAPKTNSVTDDEFIMINGADGNKIMISKRVYEQKQKIEQMKRQKVLNNYTKKEETAASDAIGTSQQRRDAEQMVKIQNMQRQRTRD